MDFLRLGDKEIGRDVRGDGIVAASLTDGEIGQVALEAQENDLRTASKIESACVIEGVQNIFICDFDGCDSGVTSLPDSAQSKVGLHSDSYPLSKSNARAKREKNGYRAQFHAIPGRMSIHKLIHFENLLPWQQ